MTEFELTKGSLTNLSMKLFWLTGNSQHPKTLSKSQKNSQESQKNSQLSQKNSQLSQKNSRTESLRMLRVSCWPIIFE